MKIGTFLTALVVLANVAHGLTLYSASDQVDTVSNRDGQLTFWFVSTNAGTFAVNTQGNIATSVSPSSGNIGAGAVKSFTVTFSPLVCSQGTFYSNINLDITSDGVTQRVSKTIEVNVQRAADCATVVQGFPETNRIDDASNTVTRSSLSFTNSFDASEVNVIIRSVDGESDIANGELLQVYLDVVNRGAPGLMEASVLADPAMNAVLSDYSFVLERSEAKRLKLTVQPRSLQGRQFVTLQVTRSGQVAAVKDIYFDVANTHLLELSMSQVINADNCGLVTIAGTASNAGSAFENAVVSIPALGAVSNEMQLAPRSTRNFVLNIDFSSLSPGSRLMEFNLSSGVASSKAVVRVNVSPCDEGDLLNYTVQFTNTGNETLKGVFATVVDVPVEWQVLTPLPVDIAPNETIALTVLVKPTGEWSNDVAPTLVVKDAVGNVLKTEKLSPVKPKASGATGLFLAGLFGISGLQWIAAIVFVALIIAVMSARASLRSSTA